MFVHGKTGKTYYSVREKINYYNKVINGKIEVSPAVKRKAKLRLKSLIKINEQDYSVPRIIMTNDKKFNSDNFEKPRICVAIKEDDKNRIFVAPMLKTNSQTIILDKDINRQISNTSEGHCRWIDKSDVYETKTISNVCSLSKYDIAKIRKIFVGKKVKKNNTNY